MSSRLTTWAGLSDFSSFGLQQKHQLFLDFEPASFQAGTYAIDSPYSQALGLWLELYHRCCGSPACQLQSWDFSASIFLWANFLQQILFIQRFCFLREPCLIHQVKLYPFAPPPLSFLIDSLTCLYLSPLTHKANSSFITAAYLQTCAWHTVSAQ